MTNVKRCLKFVCFCVLEAGITKEIVLWCMRVCVCERERERERASKHGCVRVCVCVCVCVLISEVVCVCEAVHCFPHQITKAQLCQQPS